MAETGMPSHSRSAAAGANRPLPNIAVRGGRVTGAKLLAAIRTRWPAVTNARATCRTCASTPPTNGR